MHALIIEDEDIVAMAIENILRDCGFTSFDVAPSAEMAIEAAARHTPDLITTDVQLKAGCGIAAVESIGEGQQVPIVFVTANAGEVLRRLPEHRVVTKPFSDTELIAAVASAMLNISGAGAILSAKIGSRLIAPPVTPSLGANSLN